MRSRRSIRRIAVVVILAAGVLSACSSLHPATDAPVSYSALALRSDATVSVDQFRGDPVLLTSWATWCTECQAEMPRMEAFWRAHRHDGLHVVAVNLDSVGPGSRNIEAEIQGWGLTMPVWRDQDDRFNVAFGALGVPVSVLLDPGGKVVHIWQGAINPSDEAFTRIVDPVIASREA
ncbi:MAG TPA: TlpA disulfide reductase family protein [Actinomycetota bacterium]|nr:TlpA disulfide reductase family protein [Actinomycetota bacterium]